MTAITYEQLYIYVDGAFSTATPDIYSGAFAVIDPTKDSLVCTKSGIGTKAITMRNVAGELSAAMRAAQWGLQRANTVVLFYDYEGIEKWVTGSWQAKKAETQAYRDFMRKYMNPKKRIQFVKVKAHSQNKWNEFVDKATKQALKDKRVW